MKTLQRWVWLYEAVGIALAAVVALRMIAIAIWGRW
jgi:hypothetical protein